MEELKTFVHQVLQTMEHDFQILLPFLSMDMYDVVSQCLSQTPDFLKNTNAVLSTFDPSLCVFFERVWPKLNLRFMCDYKFSSRFLQQHESLYVPVVQNASRFKLVYNKVRRSVILKSILLAKNSTKLNSLLARWGFDRKEITDLSAKLFALQSTSDSDIWNVFLDHGLGKFEAYRCFLPVFEAKLDDSSSDGLSVLTSMNIVDAEPQSDIQVNDTTVTYVPMNKFSEICKQFKKALSVTRAGKVHDLFFVFTLLRVLWSFHSYEVLIKKVESDLVLEGGLTGEEEEEELVPHKTWGLQMWHRFYQIDTIQADAVSWLLYLTSPYNSSALDRLIQLLLLEQSNTSSSDLVECWQQLLAWFYVPLLECKDLALEKMKHLMFKHCSVTVKVICEQELPELEEKISSVNFLQPFEAEVEPVLLYLRENACDLYKSNDTVFNELKSDLASFYERAQRVFNFQDFYVPQQEEMLKDLEAQLLQSVKGLSKSKIQKVFTNEFQQQLVLGDKYKIQVLTKLVTLPGVHLDTASTILKDLNIKYGGLFFPYKMLVTMCELDTQMCFVVEEYNRISLKSVKLADAVAVGAMSSYNLFQSRLQQFQQKIGQSFNLSFADLGETILSNTFKACTFETENESLDSVFKRVVVANGDALTEAFQEALVRVSVSMVSETKESVDTLTLQGSAATQQIRELDTQHDFESFEEYRQYLFLHSGDGASAEEWMKFKVLLPALKEVTTEDIESGTTSIDVHEIYVRGYPKKRDEVDNWLNLYEIVHPLYYSGTTVDDSNLYKKALDVLGFNRVIFQQFPNTSPHPFQLLQTWHNYLLL